MNVYEELFCLLWAFIFSSAYIYYFPNKIETGVIKDTNVNKDTNAIYSQDYTYKGYKKPYETDNYPEHEK